jgi:predicted XRE-type DNA-binding protein
MAKQTLAKQTSARQTFASVWDALEDTAAEAANMRARSELMIAVRSKVEGWKVNQTEAARRLGLTQPRLNDLMRGRIDKFSLDALINLAKPAGLAVRLHIKNAA